MYKRDFSNLRKTSIFAAVGISAFLILIFTTCGGQRLGGQVQGEVNKEYARAEKKSMMMDYAPAGMVNETADDSFVSHNTEEYDLIKENEFKGVKDNPLSTLSIDVDTASYSNVRRYLSGSQLPPKDAVRIEEMINYFKYSYPQPQGEHPFSINTEISEAPWNKSNRLMLIGIQGKSLNYNDLKPCNFVFLLDTSGSMNSPEKLPLLKKSLALMLKGLKKHDRIAIVAYAGSAGLVLSSTPATDSDKILESFEKLTAGGSTAGGEGIILAYKIAKENLIKDGNNRVILCTDGDFNVGAS